VEEKESDYDVDDSYSDSILFVSSLFVRKIHSSMKHAKHTQLVQNNERTCRNVKSTALQCLSTQRRCIV